MSRRSEFEDAIVREVEEWPGVVLAGFEEGGKHPCAVLQFEGVSVRRPFAGTTSDGRFGKHRMLGDLRRSLRDLGAKRAKPPESDGDDEALEYRPPNDGRDKRPNPVEAEKVTPAPSLAEQIAAVAASVAPAVDALDDLLSGVTPARAATRAATRAAPQSIDDENDGESDDDGEREARLAELQARVDAIEDGIYFNLPAPIYHAVRALGSGSICNLIVSPGTFWAESWLNPDRPALDEDATKAQIVGQAYHVARLEPGTFDSRYVRELDRADFPSRGFLSSDEKVKAALKAANQQQTITGESSIDRAERLLDTGYEGTIWPLEKARWAAGLDGRIPLSAKVWDSIVTDMERLHESGAIADKLSGGAAEVSVFWTDAHGLRCKCRFDYLRPDLWDDFKTFDNSRRKILAQAIADAFRYNRYYVQAIHYRDGAEAIRTGGLQIQGDATDAERKLIASIQIRPEELDCWYVMQEKGGVPNLLERRFEFFATPLGLDEQVEAFAPDAEHGARVKEAQRRKTGIHNLGRAEIEKAKRDFYLYSQVYPRPGQPWAPIEPSGTIGDLDFNSFWLEGR